MLRIGVVEQPIEPRITIGLQHAVEVLQMRARMHALTVGSVAEQTAGADVARRRPIVT